MTHCQIFRSCSTIQSINSSIMVSICCSVSATTSARTRPGFVLGQQVEDTPDPNRIFEELVAPVQHPGDDVLDPCQVIPELATHILLIGDQLPLDVLNRRQVVSQDRQPVLGA